MKGKNSSYIIGIIMLFVILCVIRKIITQYGLWKEPFVIRNEPNNKNHFDSVAKDGILDVNGDGYDDVDVDLNKTQYDLYDLLGIFQEMSQNKYIHLENGCTKNKYISTTVTPILAIEFDQVRDAILNRLNAKAKGKYYFKFIEYKGVTTFTDKKGNKQYIMDILVNCPCKYYGNLGLRLEIDAVKFIKPGCKKVERPKTCAELSNPGFDAYYGGYPALEQLIPLPTEVIPTGNMVIGVKGINTNQPPPVKSVYLNYVHITNSNLVVDVYNQKSLMQNLEGNQEKTKPVTKKGNRLFTPFTEKHSPFQITNYIRNPWPKLVGEKEYKPVMPKPPNWDRNSIMQIPKGKYNEVYKWSANYVPMRAEYWRAYSELPKNSGTYNWLFSLMHGMEGRIANR